MGEHPTSREMAAFMPERFAESARAWHELLGCADSEASGSEHEPEAPMARRARRRVHCTQCDGTGHAGFIEKCGRCHGSGYEVNTAGSVQLAHARPLADCDTLVAAQEMSVASSETEQSGSSSESE